MEKNKNPLPWIIGGLIIVVLLYFALQGGIGTATDDKSQQADKGLSETGETPSRK